MKPQHLALMLLICAIWGFNFVASKLAVGQFPPVFFSGLRFLGLALLMAPWLKWQKGQMHLVLPAALLMGTLHFALMFNGIALADDVAVVAVVVQLGVPISTLMAWGLLGERVRWKRGLGIALAFLGTVVITFDPKVFSYKGAILFCLASVFAMSYGQIFVRRISSVDAFTMQAWVGLISAPSLLLISLLPNRTGGKRPDRWLAALGHGRLRHRRRLADRPWRCLLPAAQIPGQHRQSGLHPGTDPRHRVGHTLPGRTPQRTGDHRFGHGACRRAYRHPA